MEQDQAAQRESEGERENDVGTNIGIQRRAVVYLQLYIYIANFSRAVGMVWRVGKAVSMILNQA